MDEISSIAEAAVGFQNAQTQLQLGVALGKTALSASKAQSNAILELLQQVAQMSEALARGEEVHVDFRV